MKTSERRCGKCTLFVAALLPVVGGCHRVTNIHGEQVFDYEPWIPLTLLFGGLAVTRLGWALRKKVARLGWGMVLLGPIVAVILAPGMLRERVVVSVDRFQVQNGVFSNHVRTFQFADLDRIQPTEEIVIGRRGRRQTNYYLKCFDKTGRWTRVPINSAVMRAAKVAILREAMAHGVRVGRGTRGRDW